MSAATGTAAPRARAAYGEPSTCKRSRQERGDCNNRCWNRKVCRVGNGEAQEHNIPGHVGHEDVTQFEKTDSVHYPGDHREHEKQMRQRTMLIVRAEFDRAGCIP